MKKLVIWTGFLALLWAPGIAQDNARMKLFFGSDESELAAIYLLQLDSLIADSAQKPIRLIRVTGHTDSRGSLAYNQKLASTRAEYVVNYLSERGIASEISSVAGESRPIKSNTTESGRAQNRRVELELVYRKPPMVFVVAKDPLPLDTGFSLPDTSYGINCGGVIEYECGNAVRLRGDDGVEVFVPSNAFVECKEDPDAKITLRLTEWVDFEKVADQEVSTMSGGEMLESAGAFRIQAFVNDKEVHRLREGFQMQVRVPAKEFDPEMAFYTTDKTNPRKFDWILNKNETLAYEKSSKNYLFSIGIPCRGNVDKANGLINPCYVIKTRRRTGRKSSLYMEYISQGTFSQGQKIHRRYVRFIGQPSPEELRLRGRIGYKKRRHSFDTVLKFNPRKFKNVRIGQQEYVQIAKLRPRRIRKDGRLFWNQRTIARRN